MSRKLNFKFGGKRGKRRKNKFTEESREMFRKIFEKSCGRSCGKNREMTVPVQTEMARLKMKGDRRTEIINGRQQDRKLTDD